MVIHLIAQNTLESIKIIVLDWIENNFENDSILFIT